MQFCPEVRSCEQRPGCSGVTLNICISDTLLEQFLTQLAMFSVLCTLNGPRKVFSMEVYRYGKFLITIKSAKNGFLLYI